MRISGLSGPSELPALMRLARSSSEGNLSLRDQAGTSSSEELLTDGEKGILRKFFQLLQLPRQHPKLFLLSEVSYIRLTMRYVQ